LVIRGRDSRGLLRYSFRCIGLWCSHSGTDVGTRPHGTDDRTTQRRAPATWFRSSHRFPSRLIILPGFSFCKISVRFAMFSMRQKSAVTLS